MSWGALDPSIDTSAGGGGGSSWLSSLGGISGLMGGVGGIGEIIGSLLQSSDYSRTLGALTGDLNDVIGPETQFGSQFLGQYENQVVPELQNEYGSQNALGNESYGSAGTYASGATGAASALESNPYIGAATPLIGGLENYKSFTPQEEAALTTGAGEASASAAATMAAQGGGTPNQALLEKQLVGQAGQTSSQTAVQLGSIASQQHLSAMEDALQGTLSQGSEYTQAESAAGGIYSGLSSEYAGLSENEFGDALNALDTQSQEASYGEGLLGEGGSSIGSVLGDVYGSASQNQGGLGGMLGGLTGIMGMFA